MAPTAAPVAISADEILKDTSRREFIMLVGKDGVGKTSALISAAKFASLMFEAQTFWVIDTENKFIPTLKTWGEIPSNLRVYKCDDMNAVNGAFAEIMDQRQPGDWLAIESASRIWNYAQDLGYQAIEGTTKADYLERRRQRQREGGKSGSPIPSPDRYWDVVKGAHDTEFIDVISGCDDLNVLMTTTVSKAREARPNRKENADRAALRAEHGIDLNMDGAPRLPYYVLTLALLERDGGQVQCAVLRDNTSGLDDPRVSFTVETRKSWMDDFWAATGR